MSTTTLAQMRDRVNFVLRDSLYNFASPAELDSFINEAYLDVVARLRLKQTNKTGTTASDGSIPLPTDYIEIESLSIGTIIPEPVDNAVYDSWKLSGNSPSQTLYRIFNDTIETYPTTNTASQSYVLRYIASPTALVDDADPLSALPKELEVRIVNYARAHASYQAGDLQQGNIYMSLYERGLPDYPRAQFRRGRGPISMVPVPSPFATSEDYIG